jgi:hypothetical protein
MNLSKEHVSQYKNSEESNEAFVADANMEEWIQTTTAADEEDNDRLSLVIQWYPSKKPLKIYQNTPNNPNKSNLRKIHIDPKNQSIPRLYVCIRCFSFFIVVAACISIDMNYYFL